MRQDIYLYLDVMLQKLMASEHYVTEINGFVQACLLQQKFNGE